jgi:hypothetical protein
MQRATMTQTSLAATSVHTIDFRVGAVISRSASLLWRRLPSYFVVGLIASSPMLLQPFTQTAEPADDETVNQWLWMFDIALPTLFDTFGRAIIIHAAFQDMRGGAPVRVIDSLNVSLRRSWLLIGLAFTDFLAAIGFFLLTVPGLILYTIWFVALPACIVEQLGISASLRRSLDLTAGHRWKALVLMLLLLTQSLGSRLVEPWLSAAAGPIVGAVGHLMWDGAWTAFDAAVVIVSYCDLRMAKEGTDIEQIAVVFD